MEPVGIAMLLIFLVVFTIGPLIITTVSKRNAELEKQGRGADFSKVRSSLGSVTSGCSRVTSATPGTVDLEAQTQQPELGECAICIGPLIPDPVHAAGSDVRPALEEVATVTVTATSPTGPPPANDAHRVDDDEILTLKTCGHAFHSKCLASWFRIQRYTCPLCRVPYYNPLPRARLSSVGSTRGAITAVPPFY